MNRTALVNSTIDQQAKSVVSEIKSGRAAIAKAKAAGLTDDEIRAMGVKA